MANIITGFRVLISIALLFCPVFSPVFYILYLTGGLSDMIDGTIARKMNTVTEFGARFDTAADFVFVVVCLIKLLPVINKYAAMAVCMDRNDCADKDNKHHFGIHCTKKVGGDSFSDE